MGNSSCSRQLARDSTVLQFPEPERSIAFDLDLPRAIAARKKVMDMVVTNL
jgi:hypothetical protein